MTPIRCVLSLLLAATLPAVADAQSRASAPLVILAPTSTNTVTLSPGSTLSVVVRLSNALTPPPGIQQQRVLRDWSARLVGHADLVEGSATYAYQLSVTNLRPQTGTSLDYRVQAPLPAWIAPGDYDLVLRGNGGEAAVARAVSVVRSREEQGAPWTLVLPIGKRVSDPPTGMRWYPATNFGSSTQSPAVVAQLPAPPALPPRIEVSRVMSIDVEVEGLPLPGRATLLRAHGVPSSAQVAWWFDDGTSAFGSATHRHVFEASGTAAGALLVIDGQGNSASARFEVQVQPGVRFGCHLHGRPGASPVVGGRAMWLLPLLPLLLRPRLLKRRPRRRPGINSPPKAVGGQGPCRLT